MKKIEPHHEKLCLIPMQRPKADCLGVNNNDASMYSDQHL